MRKLTWLTALVLVAGACTSSTLGDSGGNECPVTLSSVAFTPPEPYPAAPTAPDEVWYGTEDLWTVISSDGTYVPRLSVWWSVNFPGGVAEERPNILVTWSRLDSSEDDISNNSDGTNAHTPEDGDFMIAGADPREVGCWKVTATYKGETVTYVYEKRP